MKVLSTQDELYSEIIFEIRSLIATDSYESDIIIKLIIQEHEEESMEKGQQFYILTSINLILVSIYYSEGLRVEQITNIPIRNIKYTITDIKDNKKIYFSVFLDNSSFTFKFNNDYALYKRFLYELSILLNSYLR